jgi:hypothetical protein
MIPHHPTKEMLMSTASVAVPLLVSERLLRLQRLAQLFAVLRRLTDPLTSPEALKQAIHTLLEIAQLLGLDDDWADRLQQVLEDERRFQIVLAVVRAIAGWSGSIDGMNRLRVSSASQQVVVEAQAFVDWLPIVVQILQLLKQLRGDA